MGADLDVVKNIGAGANGSDRRPEILRHVTDLFIVNADRLSESEIELFDDVLNRLIVDIEIASRALLSMRLAPIANAPPRTICKLAWDDAIEVAAPVLIQSERVNEVTLVYAARAKSQAHKLAIAQRRTLGEAVTEALVEQGDHQVLLCVTQNPGARFSDASFQRLAQKADQDDDLAISVGAREDVPPEVFRHLLDCASDYVRTKLEALHPDHIDMVRQVVSEAKDRVASEQLGGQPSAVFAPSVVDEASKTDASPLQDVARRGSLAELSTALVRSCGMPVVFVENALTQRRSDTILMLAKAHGMDWSIVKALLSFRTRHGFMAAKEIEQSLASYERISPELAARILHFYRGQ